MDWVVAISLRGAVICQYKLFKEAVQADLNLAALGSVNANKTSQHVTWAPLAGAAELDLPCITTQVVSFTQLSMHQTKNQVCMYVSSAYAICLGVQAPNLHVNMLRQTGRHTQDSSRSTLMSRH